MQPKHLTKTLLLMSALVVIFMAILELYWRGRGFKPAYNDDKILWANSRKEVYKPADQLTVFIGGSRIKFDLDVETWEKLTGEKAVQLALVGTPARIILRDLANDEKFKGKLIIDCAEYQFFTTDTVRRERSAREALEYYHKETPAQKVSAYLDYAVESKLVFLEEGRFGLAQLLIDLKIPNRPGVINPPTFPKEFSTTSLARQSSMTPMFLADTALQNKQVAFWKTGILPLLKTPVLKGDTLNDLLEGIKISINKIRSRGGSVAFIRPPSGGLYLETESKVYPREKYWDYILTYTNSPGIYYADYPELSRLHCIENSHLSPQGAADYTASLVKILKQEKGWTFNGH
jgi:hypothetical protein